MAIVTTLVCPYCGLWRTSRDQFAQCLFCANRLIDCGDFAIRVSEERWWERRS